MAKRRTNTPQRARLAEVVTSTPWVQRPSGLLVTLAAGSYRAAENPRKRFRVVDGTGDYHLDDLTRLKLRSQSRDLERNNTFYDGGLTNWQTFIVGSGPRPIFLSRDPEWNKAAQTQFAEDAAANRLDARRLFPWQVWCAMLARGIARDGDAPVLHGDADALLLESERIEEVRLDPVGRIIGATFAAAPDAAWSSPRTAVDITRLSLPAWRTRPSQTRGHPACASSLDEWERLDSLNESEIISAETAALPWILLTSPAGSPAPPGGGKARNAGGLSGPAPEAPTGWVRTDAGSMLGLPPGLNGTPWTPNRPNLNVPEFVKMNLRMLCTPLLPYEILFLDIGSLNYAAIRGLGKLAKRRISDFRTWCLEPTISRIARDWARVQILKGRLPFVSDYAKLRWDWDDLEIRDREKEAQAVEQELKNGTTTLQDELGPTWRDTQEQRTREKINELRMRAEIIKAAKQAAAELGLSDWTQLLPEDDPARKAAAAPAPTPAAPPTTTSCPSPAPPPCRPPPPTRRSRSPSPP